MRVLFPGDLSSLVVKHHSFLSKQILSTASKCLLKNKVCNLNSKRNLEKCHGSER